MIRYRDGVVYFPDANALIAEQRNIKAAALACSLDSGAEPPAMRATLLIEVMVEGWRCGPLATEVVHLSGDRIGLHLADDTIAQLEQLMAQVKTRQHRLTDIFRKTAAEVEQEGNTTADRLDGALDSAPVLGEPTPDEPPPTDEETGEITQLFGELGGRLSLGILSDFFNTTEVDPPGSRSSLLHVFRYLHQQRASGTLTVRSPTFTKTVWLKRGLLLAVHVSPLKEDEMLGQILIKARWVSPQDLGHALRWARSQKVGIGRSLVQSNRISEDQLNKALAHQSFRRLQDLFSWGQARFEFLSECNPPPPPYHAMSVPRLMNELSLALLRDARLDHLDLLLKADEDCYPTMGTVSADYLKNLLPRDKTRQVCQQIFDGTRIVRQTIAASQLGRPKTLRLLLYLKAAGVLEMQPEPDPRLSTPTRELVQERLRSLQVQDFFQRLHVSYAVQPDQIQSAYVKRDASFAPGSAFHRADAQAAQKISVLLEEAARSLSKQSTRRKYREKIIGRAGVTLLGGLLDDELDLARLQGESERAHKLQQIVNDLSA